MKKFYQLIYKTDEGNLILFESQDLERVEEKKLDLSFKYNTGKMDIEIVYKKVKEEEKEKEQEKIVIKSTPLFDIGNGALVGLIFTLLSLFLIIDSIASNNKNR